MKKRFQAVGFALCFANFAFAAPKAIPLDTIAFTQADLNKLCQQMPNGCEGRNEKVGIYTDKQNFYFIDGGRQIALLEKTPDFFTVKTLWDFKDYQHNFTPSEDEPGAMQELEIYPAFYPLNAEKKAIAILAPVWGGYSGGYMTHQTADFVELKPDGSYDVALKSLDFYHEEEIRACFSEEEYRHNPNCHDASTTVLSIKFKEGSPYYRWELSYTTTEHPHGVSEKMRKVTKSKPVSVVPYQVAPYQQGK